jgi:hypothetical protein
MPPKPTSEKQLAANRANARRSTGPRTPEGKARAAQNARRHGFTASTFAVVRLEELDEVQQLTDDLIAVYHPINSQELFAIERIALAQQAILRAARLESGLFTASLDEALDRRGDPVTPMSNELTGDLEVTRAQNRNFALAAGFHRLVSRANSWSLFLRYQAQAERHYRRAVDEFLRLKALRPTPKQELPNEPILPAQPQQSPPLKSSPNEPIQVLPPANRQPVHVGPVRNRQPAANRLKREANSIPNPRTQASPKTPAAHLPSEVPA